jgi:flavin-dependent dehydrogenase
MAAARGRERLADFLLETLVRFPGVAGRVPSAGLRGPVQATGPFARRAARVTAPGALLLGDAADFFDPFTGEGICAALRGAELAAASVLPPLARTGQVTAGALRRYRRARRRAFAGKWIVERLIGYGMLAPALFDQAVARLERRGLAHTVIGVTGDFVPARALLHPQFLAKVVF